MHQSVCVSQEGGQHNAKLVVMPTDKTRVCRGGSSMHGCQRGAFVCWSMVLHDEKVFSLNMSVFYSSWVLMFLFVCLYVRVCVSVCVCVCVCS